MRYPLALSVLLVITFIPAWASNPGEPLDCSDWVFLEPGYSCSHFARPCESSDTCFEGGAERVVDNDGGVLYLKAVQLPQCFSGKSNWRRELHRFDGATDTVIGYVDERCGECGIEALYESWNDPPTKMVFDEENGRVLIPLYSTCFTCCLPSICTGYPSVRWIAAIEGFTTTFEILQTYTPTANEIGFRVPYMPEGFQYADYFDTYWGDLATVGDWSQAQPLQCGYPATPPSVGDYLTVEDTLPPLELGQGRYYVTAVTHQGQTRYGRRSSGGVLSGRDPTLLPGCTD
jgi:hypothetical protein